ncbi:MAG: ATP-binding protein [Defluviitaleaceae bacterium]|nr:ATP-binding protein [Defluviitaleaceae bacterium]
MKELHIEAKADNIDAVLDHIYSQIGNCSEMLKNQIGVAVDEIFSNVANYAYNPKVGKVLIRVSVGDDISIEFEDGGIAYDPLALETPDISLPVEDRKIGGLGVHIVKNIMDSATYRRENNKNILVIKKSISS